MPLYIDNKFLDGQVFSYPKHDISEEKKNKDWCLRWCKAIYYNFANDNTYYNTTWYKNIIDLRRYAQGRQNSEKYVDLLIGGKEKNQRGNYERKGYTNLNFNDIFSPAPKYMEVIQGMFESNEHTITVNAEDEQSGTEKKNLKEAMWFKEQYRPFIEMMDEKLGITRPPDDFMPQSRQELELYASMGGFKLRYEVAMEKALSHTYEISNWKQVKRKLIEDFVTSNMAAVVDEVDLASGKVKLDYIDFSELIMEYSRDWDFKNSRWGAIPRYKTVYELRTSGCNIDEDKLEGLAQKYSGMYGNPDESKWRINNVKNEDGTYGYDSYRIPTMYAAWKSFNRKYTTKKKTKNGEITTKTKFGRVYDTEQKKTSVKDIRVIYQSEWIVGTDYIFNYGLMNDTPREDNDVRLPFHVYRIKGKSIIEQMVPLLDDLQLTYLKLQNNKAKAAPPGLIVEIGALENVSLGNTKVKPLELIKMYQQDGTMLYRATPFGSHSYNFNSGPPIVPHGGSEGNAVQTAIQSFETTLNLIAEITGIARNATGTVDPSAQVGTSKMAVAATNNALRPIYAGYIDIKESCAKNSALRIQLLCKYNKSTTSGYYPVIGKTSVQSLRDAGSDAAVKWGIRIEALPTEEVKNEIKQAAQAGLAGGKNGIPAITYGEYLYIVEKLNTGANFTEMRAYIAYKEAERDKKAAEMQQQNIQLQQEEARKTEEAKTQMELQKIQTEKQLDAQNIVLEEEEKRKTMVLEYQLKTGQYVEQKTVDQRFDNSQN